MIGGIPSCFIEYYFNYQTFRLNFGFPLPLQSGADHTDAREACLLALKRKLGFMCAVQLLAGL